MTPGGTMSVLAARPAVDGLLARGLDPNPALAAAGLSREALARVDHRLDHGSVRALWEAAATTARDPSFGVHVAESLTQGSYEVYDYLLSSSATVGEAIVRLARYASLICDQGSYHLVVEPRQCRLVRRVAALAPQYDEFEAAYLLRRCRQSCGATWAPMRMSFQHDRVDDDAEQARVFGCPLHYGAADTELVFAPAVLRLPHVHSDSRLLEILTRYADLLLNALPSRGDLVTSVSRAIARQLARRPPSLTSTAAVVHVPPRTLQRRLAAAGITHTRLVDDVRRDLALKYIADAALSIGEVAYLLHFADSTAFHRAFKRWTGESPASYRRRQRQG